MLCSHQPLSLHPPSTHLLIIVSAEWRRCRWCHVKRTAEPAVAGSRAWLPPTADAVGVGRRVGCARGRGAAGPGGRHGCHCWREPRDQRRPEAAQRPAPRSARCATAAGPCRGQPTVSRPATTLLGPPWDTDAARPSLPSDSVHATNLSTATGTGSRRAASSRDPSSSCESGDAGRRPRPGCTQRQPPATAAAQVPLPAAAAAPTHRCGHAKPCIASTVLKTRPRQRSPWQRGLRGLTPGLPRGRSPTSTSSSASVTGSVEHGRARARLTGLTRSVTRRGQLI